ncbi:16147_t:CDS:2 [Gigaspora rosea]|nr:16147_t:CDS:2 [Gigaspora rosea]
MSKTQNRRSVAQKRRRIRKKQLAWDYQELQNIVDSQILLLNTEQLIAYNAITNSVTKQEENQYFAHWLLQVNISS